MTSLRGGTRSGLAISRRARPSARRARELQARFPMAAIARHARQLQAPRDWPHSSCGARRAGCRCGANFSLVLFLERRPHPCLARSGSPSRSRQRAKVRLGKRLGRPISPQR